jgi:hypothetical protein
MGGGCVGRCQDYSIVDALLGGGCAGPGLAAVTTAQGWLLWRGELCTATHKWVALIAMDGGVASPVLITGCCI